MQYEHTIVSWELHAQLQCYYVIWDYLFKVGENVSACWPPNAQNKNCPERYLRFPGTISGLNADGTYAVEYFDGLHAGNVREMWIQNLAEEEFMERKIYIFFIS